MNYRARSIQQSGVADPALSNSPYTNAGLKGDGQVVGIGDTGLDVTSCYFSDSQGSVSTSAIDSPYFNFMYRKVIQYAYNPNGGDTSDIDAGHGTHVCGTVIGNKENADITIGKMNCDDIFDMQC